MSTCVRITQKAPYAGRIGIHSGLISQTPVFRLHHPLLLILKIIKYENITIKIQNLSKIDSGFFNYFLQCVCEQYGLYDVSETTCPICGDYIETYKLEIDENI